ncbi:hypothetical protein NKDENANG_03780 [Candidatus Entotheonellaceae bacterium PAL068K]
MWHKHFIYRQLRRSKKHATIFVLCVVLSMVTLVALGGFSQSVHTSLLRDARALHAGDIIIHSHYPLSTRLAAAVTSLQQQGLVEWARVYEFYSVVRSTRHEASVLAHLKVVEPGYPFYGRVELDSKRAFADVLRPGSIIVEAALLDRLGLRLGDRVHVGKTQLLIRDVVIQEPDRPVTFLSLGPRIFIAAADLEALALVQQGSRVAYNHLLKVGEAAQVKRLAARLRAVASEQERVETFRTAESGVKRFFDNFLFFLSLLGIFTLLLAGIGINSALTALLRDSQQSIAIMKTVGATRTFITAHYLGLVAVLGLFGTLLGLAFGVLCQHLLPMLFTGLLPRSVVLQTAWSTILAGLLLGSCVVALFAFLPLYRLQDLKPNFIFRKDHRPSIRGFPYYLTHIVISLFFIAMILWHIQEVYTGTLIAFGILVFILMIAIATRGILSIVKKLQIKSLPLRQALKGLFRPGNATQSIIITLTASLALMFAISLIEHNLDASFVQSYPDDAPNLFFIDIQAAQLEAFRRTLGLRADYYPVVKARLLAINGQAIDRQRERQRRSDNLAREFHLTYRSHLLADEAIIAGPELFRDDWEGAQVSVLDTVVKMKHMAIGDRLTFKIQGIPLDARIASIRTRQQTSVRPFFYFVFPERDLGEAPQTLFTAVRSTPDQIPGLQHRMVSAFPNVSVIDVSATLSTFAQVMRKLSTILRFFTLFSLTAGILLIINSVLATRLARIREAVYFKILGARGRFIAKVLTLEHLLLGLISALLALALAHLGSWIIIKTVLDMAYRPFIGLSLLMSLGAMLLVIVIGWLASSSILRHRPATFLREYAEG